MKLNIITVVAMILILAVAVGGLVLTVVYNQYF
jgi:hypothetical protein